MFIVMEIQTNIDETVGTIVTTYADQYQAESKFHDVLKYAAVSALPKHACIMTTEEGIRLREECYVHPEAVPAE